MDQPLTPIHPAPGQPCPLAGHYLHAPLVPAGHEGLFVYANFVRSLDGRIAVRERDGREQVPGDVANPRDWRLYQELAARADVLLSSGRYLRELAAGDAQAALPVGPGADFADLRAWRREHGLREQPDVAILSASLDFRVPRELLAQGRRVLVLTVADTDRAAARRFEDRGVEVVGITPAATVRGADATRALDARGYRRAYFVTGPRMLHTFIADDCLDALFLTTVHRLIGGRHYAGILEGDRLSPAADWRLSWLAHDPHGPGTGGQQFARYDRV